MKILGKVTAVVAAVLIALGVVGPRIAGAFEPVAPRGITGQELEFGLEGPAASAVECGAYSIGSAWGRVVDYGSNNFCNTSVAKIQAVRYLEYDAGGVWEIVASDMSECVNCSGLQALGSVAVGREGTYRTNTVYCVTNGDITCGATTKNFVVG
ncbi:MAG: hypothetical protein HY681_01945 [Chloroflexi bacterium]|nr:hypothetical protein [Chloroflexota bacterium]